MLERTSLLLLRTIKKYIALEIPYFYLYFNRGCIITFEMCTFLIINEYSYTYTYTYYKWIQRYLAVIM